MMSCFLAPFSLCIVLFLLAPSTASAEGLVTEYRFDSVVDNPLQQVEALEDGIELAGEGFRVRVGASGSLEVNVGEDRYNVETHLSYPRDSIGWNDLGVPGPSCDPRWRPELEANPDGSLAVVAAAEYYTLVRTVRIAAHRIIVTEARSVIERDGDGWAVKVPLDDWQNIAIITSQER